MIASGDNYKGRAIKGSVQLGETPNGTLQIAVDMELKNAQDPEGKIIGKMTTFLYFSEGAAVYSYERLRLLGWKGAGPDDIDKMDDIFENWVPCRVTVPEPYKDPKDGSMKMGQSKLEIMAGAGTVTLNKPLGSDAFKARLKAVGGGGGSTGTGGSAAGGPAPPF